MNPTPQPIFDRASMAYQAGVMRGVYDVLREKLGRRPPSKSVARKLAQLRADAQTIEHKLGLEVEWPE